MEQRLEADHYVTPEDFIRDAGLIFKNCKKYNNETTTYYKNAVKLEKFLNAKLREIPEWFVSTPNVNFDRVNGFNDLTDFICGVAFGELIGLHSLIGISVFMPSY